MDNSGDDFFMHEFLREFCSKGSGCRYLFGDEEDEEDEEIDDFGIPSSLSRIEDLLKAILYTMDRNNQNTKI